MSDTKDIKADFWTGVFWIVFGGAVLAQSTHFPIPRHLGATALTAPGLVPGALGVALILLGLVLALRARRGRTIVGQDGPVDPESVSIRRPLIAAALMVAYAWALTSGVSFIPLTTVFVTVFVTAFNWDARSTPSRVKTVVGSAVMAVIFAFVLQFVFEQLFYVRLP
mgnify:CR=1 FL=1|tara:strand:+ start:6388 stop:6888 length:501 start_codon:yes stop_codon:yes gene_type:complete